MVLWGSSFVALKIAFRHFDPWVVIFGRMAVASLCFAPFLRGLAGTDFRLKDLKLLLFMAVCEPGFYFVFEAQALMNTSASQAGMITAMLPLMVAAAAAVTLKERLSRRTALGFAMAVAGAVWLSAAAESDMHAPNPLLGNFLEFLAMVCATGYMICCKHLSARYNPWFLTAVQSLVGVAFYLPLLFLPSTRLPTVFPMLPTAAVIYLGSAVTLLAYGLYNYGLSRLPAGQSSAFVNLIPVVTVLLGHLILGEDFTGWQYAASGLVMLGVLVSQDPGAQALPEGPGAA
jgi:drug/metabolite transporter (DMT)-like permease